MSRRLGSIFNNDCNNILASLDGERSSPADYRRVVEVILDRRPGVLAQDVGLPDPVLFRSRVATPFSKYVVEVSRQVWPETPADSAIRQQDLLERLYREGTDPLRLTVEACRARGTPVLASFRMNAEDWYHSTYLLSDFGRAHPEWRLRRPDGELAGNLDPAVPEVFEHRLRLFSEVADAYEIDGIEFDFRRWYHMVSDPLRNHVVLTRMVRATRRLLDETARRKGRGPMLLGARVGPSLDSEPSPFLFPGIFYPDEPVNASCRQLGLDVRTWIGEGLADYLCPSLFLASLPGMPLTKEFAELAQGTDVGIYPTLWPLAAWMHGVCQRRVDFDERDQRPLALYRHDLCAAALRMHEDGADGISTFNWYSHLRDAAVPHLWNDGEGASGSAADAVQRPTSIPCCPTRRGCAGSWISHRPCPRGDGRRHHHPENDPGPRRGRRRWPRGAAPTMATAIRAKAVLFAQRHRTSATSVAGPLPAHVGSLTDASGAVKVSRVRCTRK